MNKLLLVLVAVMVAYACSGRTDANVYTLYRDSPLDKNEAGHSAARIHIGTFDSSDGEKYNQENCNQARTLFQAQPGIVVRFWCEKGRYRQ